jgi:dTMP kinase
MHPETESLLMFAARREHLDQVIRPALERGVYVISDRFTDASFAYQCGGRGVSTAKVGQLEQWVQGDFQPDLTLLFDLPVAVSTRRLAGARNPDRFEKEGEDFFNRIRNAYLARAEQFPQRFRVIDSGKTISEIQAELQAMLSML